MIFGMYYYCFLNNISLIELSNKNYNKKKKNN